MVKFDDISQTLEHRIRNGDYRLRSFPAPRELAAELGASRQTVCKALNKLVHRGMLTTTPAGRVMLAPTGRQAGLHLATLGPAQTHASGMTWHDKIEELAGRRGWSVRPVIYTHWHDPVIREALQGFDGIFFRPYYGDLPADLIEPFKTSPAKVVVMEQNLSAQGLPSLRLPGPSSVLELLEHLYALGHRSIACLNTQPVGEVMRERIEHWRLWTSAHQVEAPLLDHAVQTGCSAMEQARSVMHQLMQTSQLNATAVFCTTGATGLGAIRGIADAGLRAGRDIALCAADDHGGQAQYAVPSMTSMYLEPPQWEPYFQAFLDWFASSDRRWPGPLLVQPANALVFVGESTDPASAHAADPSKA